MREKGEVRALGQPPFANGDIAQWAQTLPAALRLARTQPLAGLDMHVGAGSDSGHGLGLPDSLVTPSSSLLACVGATIRSGPFRFDDDEGPLLELRTWRTLYETSDYHQPWPRLIGSALVVSRRGFERLAATAPRLVLRDFIDRRVVPAAGM